ncbi:hypothetical protein OU798_19090 [Prolixibacteraceae bacterium Z1-6]|uniref:Glycosyl hydrolase family 38 n=1 Tax=Draconibacterium aestuarii TaxID=2998507 RepID=A0A9X3F8I9_9BACT|nr:hypothetical protein [Prolixibacteraceae bacterium Z1-6]
MKTRLLVWLLMLACGSAYSQALEFTETQFVNGFSQAISGDDFSYHSSISQAKESLMARATSGFSTIEWETSPVPAKVDEDYVTFVWLAGLGSSPGKARFDLYMNDSKAFEIWADGSDSWVLDGNNRSTLSFQKDMIDQHGDRFGFMFLKIPASQVKTGEPLRLKVVGGKFDLSSWYMTFKFQMKSGFDFKAYPAIVEKDGVKKQLGYANIIHFGGPTKAQVYINNKLTAEQQVDFGYNNMNVDLPVVNKSKTVNYRLVIGDFVEKGKIVVNPVREWRVNFVQHVHTDIGYTRSQTDILGEHLRYIDYALDYCDLTDDYPDDAKFRWTLEATWPVNEYLRSRPASQIERLKKRIEEGRIEMTAMYFNFDELPDEQILAASLQPLKRIYENGIDTKLAMQNDVNGIGWCFSDYYHDLGIKYLNMGTHGHRALICFDKPTLFWWESPSGKRMLAYRGEHYMTGNTVFKIHAEDFLKFEEELLSYLVRLEDLGYEYDVISIQHSGYQTDNSPPSMLASEMIKQWNDKYSWPKLKTASATEFFEEMEAKHGDEFQVIRGAWPDWWTDGFGASAREVAATRTAQTDIIANGAGLSMAVMQGSSLPEDIDKRIEAINDALLFYTEHTVGYHASIAEPFHKYTMEQRAIKESYAWEAGRRAKMIGEETMGLLQSHVQRGKEPSILVYNTLTWDRNGLLRVYIDHQILPRYKSFKIVDGDGKEAFAQPVERHSDGTYWAVWVDDVPAFGYKKYKIVIDETKLAAESVVEHTPVKSIENKWYKVDIDQEKGTIKGLFDKELNKELTDTKSEYQLGEFIYELLGDRSQMESFKLDNYTRESLEKVRFELYEEGPVWNTVRFKGDTKAANTEGGFIFEIRLFNTAKRIDLHYFINKKMVTDPEGIYIAFPFEMENGQLSFDVQGGEVRAGIDQIPGSTADWNVVQNYARLGNADAQILLSSNEIPLMQFGGINTGRYEAGATPETNHIFGWPMNNYWTTNFNAEQHGGIEWNYTITSTPDNSAKEAVRFGWGNRVPFLSRVLPGGGDDKSAPAVSFIGGWPENVLLVNISPENEGESAIMQLREVNGQTVSVDLNNQISGEKIKMEQVNVLGEPIVSGSTELKPFELKFFRISTK